MTREQWLEMVTNHYRADFEAVGSPLPDSVRVSCGFTSQGRRGKRIGECWTDTASEGGVHEIFIVPRMSDSIAVGAILVHELVHAAVGVDKGHKGPFRKVATALGLEGKMTATVPGEITLARLAEIIAEIGEYPHAVLNSTGQKKQSTRMLKMECAGCGFVARTTAKWLDEIGPPTCACDGETVMSVA